MNAKFEPVNGLWDKETFPLTEEYKTAIKNLLIAEIKMMRQVFKNDAECWYCGAATIDNFERSDNLSLTFGGKDEAEDMAESADIFVIVELA